MASFRLALRRRLTPEDFERVIDIADRTLGPGYLTRDELAAFLDTEQGQPGHLGRIWTLVGEVAGFGSARLLRKGGLAEHLERLRPFLTKGRLLDELPAHHRVGLLDQVIVEPEFQNRGVGSQQAEFLSWQLKEAGAKRLLATAWHHDGHTPLAGVLRRQGFTSILQVDNFWRQDSLLRGYRCQACGTPPCGCSAEIFVR